MVGNRTGKVSVFDAKLLKSVRITSVLGNQTTGPINNINFMRRLADDDFRSQ